MPKNRRLPQHILVLRLSAMGDVAMLPYAVGDLKKAYPDVKVTVATRPEFRPFFGNLDIEFLPVDVKKRYHGFSGLITLSKILRRTGIDAFADEHGVLRSVFLRLMMRLHGVKVARIDKGKAEKRELLKARDKNDIWLKHTVTRYCDTFRALGFDFPDPPKAEKRPRPNPLPEAEGRVKVGFAPFSAHQGKTCPDGKRQEITRLLCERFDRVFIHSGGGAEAVFAQEMEHTYPNVTAVYGKVKGLEQEMDLISNLDCMVSMDSLAMHLSSLVATPVVSVWGATHPKLGFLGYGAPRDGIVQADLDCRPCSTYGNKECRLGTYSCLSAISPVEVVDRVEAIIAKYGANSTEQADEVCEAAV